MALYDSIKDDLLSKIEDGTYQEGQTIPSEVKLAEMYGVSRATIRQAIQILASDGYLEKRRRRGTVVTKPKVDQSFTMSIHSFEDAMRMEGRMPKTNVLMFKSEPSSEIVAKMLEMRKNEGVFKLVRLRYVDEQPNVFVESYVPCSLYPSLGEFDFNKTSLYDAMGQCGGPVMDAHRRFEAIKANDSTSALLDVGVGDPLILFHTVARNKEGIAVEYSVATYRGKSNVFELFVSREGSDTFSGREEHITS